MFTRIVLFHVLLLAACGLCPRAPSVDPSDPKYGRFEGISARNACALDSDCVVGGCGNEVCAAEPLASTCELLKEKPSGACGCVEGQCVWHQPECGGGAGGGAGRVETQ